MAIELEWNLKTQAFCPRLKPPTAPSYYEDGLNEEKPTDDRKHLNDRFHLRLSQPYNLYKKSREFYSSVSKRFTDGNDSRINLICNVGLRNMNNLETALSNSFRNARKTYVRIAGNFLFTAPEHFIQNAVFLGVGKGGFQVRLEESRKKISRRTGIKSAGRPHRRKIRYDLVIYKKGGLPRSVIEIKRARRLRNEILSDAKRIISALKGKNSASSGYLIIYGIFPPKVEPTQLFKQWSKRLKLKVIWSKVFEKHANNRSEAGCIFKATKTEVNKGLISSNMVR